MTLDTAARALVLAQSGEDCFDALEPEAQESAREHCRAVLRAIREPDKRMIEAGASKAEDCVDSTWDSGPDGEGYNSYEVIRSDAPFQIWQAMIDAALAE